MELEKRALKDVRFNVVGVEGRTPLVSYSKTPRSYEWKNLRSFEGDTLFLEARGHHK